MAGKRKKEEGKKGAPEYMLTYGDMMTLLLCFFVMLLAMSTIDPAKFHVAASSFQNAFSGVLEDFPSIVITKDILIPRLGGDEQNKRMAIDARRRIREVAKQENMQDGIKVKITDSGLAIKIADPIGFSVGSAEIRPEFIDLLYKLIKIINIDPNAKIRVEGHTDNTPISTQKFPSNWELSASRALNIVKFFAYNCGIDPARLSAVGYGEYRPVAPNDTPKNRQKNRRIEIYVEYLKKQESEQAKK
ncbi:MAG: OmpA family protein [Chitinivibrionales bacterium]|nr:OmpA family protein [Chitinivibrionales bacterium]